MISQEAPSTLVRIFAFLFYFKKQSTAMYLFSSSPFFFNLQLFKPFHLSLLELNTSFLFEQLHSQRSNTISWVSRQLSPLLWLKVGVALSLEPLQSISNILKQIHNIYPLILHNYFIPFEWAQHPRLEHHFSSLSRLSPTLLYLKVGIALSLVLSQFIL